MTTSPFRTSTGVLIHEHDVPAEQEHLDHGHCVCGRVLVWDLRRGRWVPATRPKPVCTER